MRREDGLGLRKLCGPNTQRGGTSKINTALCNYKHRIQLLGFSCISLRRLTQRRQRRPSDSSPRTLGWLSCSTGKHESQSIRCIEAIEAANVVRPTRRPRLVPNRSRSTQAWPCSRVTPRGNGTPGPRKRTLQSNDEVPDHCEHEYTSSAPTPHGPYVKISPAHCLLGKSCYQLLSPDHKCSKNKIKWQGT